jgi:hypothetical protein
MYFVWNKDDFVLNIFSGNAHAENWELAQRRAALYFMWSKDDFVLNIFSGNAHAENWEQAQRRAAAGQRQIRREEQTGRNNCWISRGKRVKTLDKLCK